MAIEPKKRRRNVMFPSVAQARAVLEAAWQSTNIYLVCWVAASCSLILHNQYIYDELMFPFPLALTTCHLFFATLATQALARCTSVLDGPVSGIGSGATAATGAVGGGRSAFTWRWYIDRVVPIGLAYSLSLACCNIAYLHLSIGFIQMLKSTMPVVVLAISALFGLEQLTAQKLKRIAVVFLGVLLAGIGEVRFTLLGFFFQAVGTTCEATRLVLTERLLYRRPIRAEKDAEADLAKSDKSGHGAIDWPDSKVLGTVFSTSEADDDEPDIATAAYLKDKPVARLDPLVALYYFTPICALINLLLAIAVEGTTIAALWRATKGANPGVGAGGSTEEIGGSSGAGTPSSLFEWCLAAILPQAGSQLLSLPRWPATLLANAALAFVLNASVVMMVANDGGLALTFASVFKDILLIAVCGLRLGYHITAVQLIGYGIALIGLIAYRRL